jgi:hypothetical protein
MRSAAPGTPAFCGPACSTVYTGTLDGLRKIARTEGMAVLWRGTDVALLMAIPMVGIYLPLYDYLLAELQQRQVGVTAPLWAGTLARTASVLCTAPLELVRTRLQAAHLLSDGMAGASSCCAGCNCNVLLGMAGPSEFLAAVLGARRWQGQPVSRVCSGCSWARKCGVGARRQTGKLQTTGGVPYHTLEAQEKLPGLVGKGSLKCVPCPF